MKHEMRTTEQGIVKDIMEYNFPKDEWAKNTLIAKVVAFALDNMSEDYAVEDKQVNVNTDKYIKKRNQAYIQLFNSKVGMNPKAFTSRKYFGEDIISICHEICHFAENAGEISSGKKYTGNSTCIDLDMFRSFITHYIMAVGEYSKFKSPEGLMNTIGSLNKRIADYSYARYILDPFEARARRFACDMLEKMIDIAKEDIGVNTACAYLNIKQMQDNLSTRRDKDYVDIAKANKVMTKDHKVFVDMVRSARSGLLLVDNNGKNAFDRLKDIPAGRYANYIMCNGNILQDSFVGLMIDYDENMANILVDTILTAGSEIYDNHWNQLAAICTRTSFVPNGNQIRIMQERGSRDVQSIDSVIEQMHDTPHTDFDI